ncbi:mechanosensitive ion channel domain-containing protein [Neptuniibacter pectenicola]|jgi:small-conductance mechanosensitive channel|uniref:Mechanosensitive ion channel domain-containing protein n=1 Tax=Neptuniibacter pectenicola TaxID=1806669 RepID=A0ABU9TNG0_9GAMM|nr:mechanosensitive ion channel domain-containing protein [Neptuniibacter pectenicola]
MTEFWNYPLLNVGEYQLLANQLVICITIIILTFVIASFVKKWFKYLAKTRAVLSHDQMYIIVRLAHYVIIVAGLLMAVASLGIDISKLALIASALGIGIGLGLQGIVNNFVSGVAIMLERSLKVGDFIELDTGITGEVMEIHMRATLIRTNDNVDILIPNADLTNSNVINWTLEESIRRFRIPVGVAYGSDKDLVKQAMLEAAAVVPYTLTLKGKEPIVWMTGFGDSSLDFTLGVWVTADQVKRPTAIMSDYLWAIDDAFRKYKIEIPFPQRDLHLRSLATKVTDEVRTLKEH